MMPCLHPPPAAVAAALLGLLGAGGCGPGDAMANRHDNAEWVVASEPSLRLGVADGDAALVFHRIAGARRLADGRVAVADGGSVEVRYFDPTGRFLSAVGRRGGGLGEFQALTWLGDLGADTLLAWDHLLARATVLGPEGDVARVLTLEPRPPGMFPQLAGVLGGGSMIIVSGWDIGSLGAAATGARRDSMAWVRYGPDGVLRDTIAVAPGREEFLVQSAGSFTTNPVPFARQTYSAVAASVVWLGDSGSGVIEGRSPRGLRTHRIEWPEPPRPVTPADVNRYRRERLGRITVDSYRELQEEVLRLVPFPSTMPLFGGLRVDDQGMVWIREYSAFPDEPQVWRVYEPNGRAIARARLAAGLGILDIGLDHVLVREVDDMEVERVLLYSLTRTAGR
jgi:hypothetical protein